MTFQFQKRNNQKKYHQKLVCQAASQTSTGASMSPDSERNFMPEYIDDEEDDNNYEDVYFDDFSPRQSDYEADGMIGLASDDDDNVPGAVGYAGSNRYDFRGCADSVDGDVSNVREKK